MLSKNWIKVLMQIIKYNYYLYDSIFTVSKLMLFYTIYLTTLTNKLNFIYISLM